MKALNVLLVLCIVALIWEAKSQRTALTNVRGQLVDVVAKLDAKPQTASLDLQAKCASQAERSLIGLEKKMAGYGYEHFSQSNHYNSTLNRCFVLIGYSPKIQAGTRIDTVTKAYQFPTGLETLMDAYESSELAACTYYGNLIGVDPGLVGSNPEAPMRCTIGTETATYQEFGTFVSRRMESRQ